MKHTNMNKHFVILMNGYYFDELARACRSLTGVYPRDQEQLHEIMENYDWLLLPRHMG